MGMEGLIMITMIMVVVAGVLMLVTHKMRGYTDSASKTIASLEESVNESSNTEQNYKTNQNTDKQENQTVKQPINNPVANQQSPQTIIKEVQTVKEVQVPVSGSFIDSVGSNILGELIGAVIIAGVTWFIRDYLKMRKKHKLNMNKDS